MNPLEQLRAAGTVVIADTADFEKITNFKASEGTTNPSLLYQAAQNASYSSLLAETVAFAKSMPTSISEAERLSAAVDFLAVQFGTQIYKLTGKISTEVDVTLSFDTAATVASALRIIDLYTKQGVPKEGIRIKISATWEGIQAARILQAEHNVSCLVTIVFGMTQAIAAAEAGVDAIAPYVGRLSDWGALNGFKGDLGISTVSNIQNYLRKYGFKTQVMAASFRNVNQVTSLAGIDLLTAAPAILEAVEKETNPIEAKLTPGTAFTADLAQVSYINNEAGFRWAFNSDACAVEKSADAMRRFAQDTQKLKDLLSAVILG
ncbi:transaldolase [Thozetella sp. PMI_491]|nr:transaldolase [Thozetella sp. PMI_491]